ncbi:hypothetical protein JW756_07035 [Candidatus Woesearchaeota archaeon]|nr:hypothetical protein [Candidatus Woesearchaeota archaeon]
MKDPNNKAKSNMPRIKPSMRMKERYVAYEVKSNSSLPWNADKLLISNINSLLGVFMAPKAAVASIKYNAGKQIGILRLDRKFVDCLRTCFSMIKNINNNEVTIRTLRVSGMVGKLKKYLE